jgi:hypothetical protein
MAFEAERITRTNEITLNGKLKEVFPLFGPIRECDWAPGFAPKVIYLKGDLIEEHMVFTTQSHHGQEPDSTWIVSRYEPEGAFVEYTVFSPDRLWLIQIGCRETNSGEQTIAKITYTYTGLTEGGNHTNKKAMEAMFKYDLKDWEIQINHYLATGQQLEHH